MDFCLLLLAKVPNVGTPEKQARHYKEFDIVNVFDATTQGTLQGQDYVHNDAVSDTWSILYVTDCPFFITLDMARSVLERVRRVEEGNDYSGTVEMREFGLSFNNPQRNALTSGERTLTLSWTQFRGICVKKRNGANIGDGDFT